MASLSRDEAVGKRGAQFVIVTVVTLIICFDIYLDIYFPRGRCDEA